MIIDAMRICQPLSAPLPRVTSSLSRSILAPSSECLASYSFRVKKREDWSEAMPRISFSPARAIVRALSAAVVCCLGELAMMGDSLLKQSEPSVEIVLCGGVVVDHRSPNACGM